MLTPDSIPASPPPELRYKRTVSVTSRFVLLWQQREVIRSLADRDFRARYKQAVLGVSWAVIQPLAMVAIFTVVIQRALKVGTSGVPYAIWAFLGLVAWSFFAEAMTLGSASLVANQPLINKVNCPREAFPVASVVLAAVDGAISLAALPFFFVGFGFLPSSTIYWVPVIFVVQVLFTIGAVLIVSVALVYVRDLRQIVPILVQLGMFASPVAYNVTNFIPHALRLPYDALNPMAPIIEAYRNVALYHSGPGAPFAVAAVSSMVFFVVGFRVFRRLDTGIADLI